MDREAKRPPRDPKEIRETSEDKALLKRFKILSMVGVGNYARVYKALLVQNNKNLAIKAINLAKTTDNYRQKFLPRELSILRRVNHENICKIYEIIQVAERIFIVMQYCSRGTIADLLQKNGGPFRETVARFLFAPTIAAVVYLHSNDIAHRDIKIENILLDSNYTPKLTDFSYSCLMKASDDKSSSLKETSSQSRRGSLRLTETFCGTLPYLSPEMIRRLPYDPKKTDSWSLGICLYVLLNDHLPFPFGDIKIMVRKQLAKEFDSRPSVQLSENSRDLLNQLLDPDPLKRLGSWDTSRHCWFNGPRERPPGTRSPK